MTEQPTENAAPSTPPPADRPQDSGEQRADTAPAQPDPAIDPANVTAPDPNAAQGQPGYVNDPGSQAHLASGSGGE